MQICKLKHYTHHGEEEAVVSVELESEGVCNLQAEKTMRRTLSVQVWGVRTIHL